MVILQGSTLYLDANVFIHFAEGETEKRAVVLELLEGAGEHWSIVTSDLTLAEVLVVPYRTGNRALIEAHEEMLAPRPGFERLPISDRVLREAARLRAVRGLKLPDAIHLATAVLASCGMLVTEDKRFPDAGGLEVVGLDEVAKAVTNKEMPPDVEET